MEATVTWAGGAAFIGKSAGGHSVVIDGPPEGGGRNLGPRPMEMLLLGMGACTAYDVVSILKKSRQQISDCHLKINATRAEDHPRIFTAIHVHFTLTGKNLDPGAVERAIRLSADKYCSASQMLAKTATITHDYEIREAVAESPG